MATKEYPRCATCRFWDGEACDSINYIDFRSQLQLNGFNAAMLIKADDDSGLDGTFLTRADFGCINHETEAETTEG